MADRILIIEGKPKLREVLTSLLTEAGFRVADVCDYPEALLKFDEFKPNIAIVDEELPGGDGKDVCSQLHAVSIPVILLGKDGSGEAREAVVEAGADFYFSGLTYHREFVARVKAVLRRYERAAL